MLSNEVFELSLITVVGNKNFISIMSDGRVTGLFPSENFNKIIECEDFAYVAIWGQKVINTDLLRVLTKSMAGLRKSTNPVDLISNIVSEYLKRIDYELKQFMIVWGGRNNGKLKMCQLRGINSKTESLILDDTELIVLCATNKGYANDFLMRELANVSKKPDSVIECQKRTNSYVASLDGSVNNTIFNKVISLDETMTL